MQTEEFIQRWYHLQMENNYLFTLFDSNLENAPFGKTDLGKYDFRGIDFKGLNASLNINGLNFKNIVFRNCDFSFSNLDHVILENCQFINCTFVSVYCRDLLDLENIFESCHFCKVDFRRASIGNRNSKFNHCVFDTCNFMRCFFASPQFTNVEFVNCNLRELDFGGSSFENCLFEGKMSYVLFKGDDPTSKINNSEYKKNEMKNVSFEKLDFQTLAFSDNCNLENIKIMSNPNYILVKGFKRKITELNQLRNQYTTETIDFIEIQYGIAHERNQNSYLFNMEDWIDEDSNLAEMIEVFNFLKNE